MREDRKDMLRKLMREDRKYILRKVFKKFPEQLSNAKFTPDSIEVPVKELTYKEKYFLLHDLERLIFGKIFGNVSDVKGKDSIQIQINFTKPNDSIFKEKINEISTMLAEIQEEHKAYTLGAIAGALSGTGLPNEALFHIGKFLRRKEGGRLAGTNTKAYQFAKIVEDNKKKQFNK